MSSDSSREVNQAAQPPNINVATTIATTDNQSTPSEAAQTNNTPPTEHSCREEGEHPRCPCHHNGHGEVGTCLQPAGDGRQQREDIPSSSHHRHSCDQRGHEGSSLNFDDLLPAAEASFREAARKSYWQWCQVEQNWYHGPSSDEARIWYPKEWLASAPTHTGGFY
ncbi:hypothetical protein MKZ38_009895 [Zalerion maritima]|uniref:Uncharacterized protein n=1 Tax=Zalerion maritima TaxID=339359 RepID=A0AAD5WN05_9PEZI|nr:hypothetical protein MKZ38_009895 [Zalerion maritima]